jgi:D-glycero-alpha-D-manno-heptose-7-phosphate kinase
MIGVRTPFRISFVGGGTDLPQFFKKNGGKVISSTIDKYMYHFINKFDDTMIQIKYSQNELVENPKYIKHPIVREVSKLFDLEGLDINSIADIGKGTGLGSSSAYTVGLVNGLTEYEKRKISKSKLASISADIEINKVGDPIGKQDHYASAFGGMNKFTFFKDGRVKVQKINLTGDEISFLNSSMILYRYGTSRSASKILKQQNLNLKKNKYVDLTRQIYNLVDDMESALLRTDIKSIGEILNENWNIKKQLSKSISNANLEKEIKLLTSHKGIHGGKLLGAGNSGYLLLVGEPSSINKINKRSVARFTFENEGSTIILND